MDKEIAKPADTSILPLKQLEEQSQQQDQTLIQSKDVEQPIDQSEQTQHDNKMSQLHKTEYDYTELLKKKEQFLGRRVECLGFYGTVKYSGVLTHEGKPPNSEKQLWFGVEWDDETRGRHTGTIKDTVYFTTTGCKNSGTLVKFEKVNLGIDILDGILAKYFKEDIPTDLKQNLLNKIEEKHAKQVIKKDIPDSLQQEMNAKKSEEFKQNNDLVKTKLIQVEMDQDAYFETFKKHKKMVQFYGFDKIWERLNNISDLSEISLKEVNISEVGEQGYLSRLLRSMKILSLEKNLLFDWDQIFQIGNELPELESLSITSNYLIPLTESVLNRNDIKNEKHQLLCWNQMTRIAGVTPLNVFPQLHTLILIDCRLNWMQVSRLLPAFPALKELFLCRNIMTDFENISLVRSEDVSQLTLLDLGNTHLEDIEGLKPLLIKLTKLQRLILNQNKISSLGVLPVMSNLTNISLEWNQIESSYIFSELAQFPALTYLNIKHNPIGDKLGRSYVRQRAVAEIPTLKVINGSDLKKYERKDCEIYYLRHTFDDYFKLTGQVYYKYDMQAFLDWVKVHHPNHYKLMHKYGNPYEQQPEDPNINITENQAPKNIMIPLILVAAAGSQLGKPDKTKKFPDNTTILSLKNVLSKLYGIPNDKIVLKYKVNQHDPNEILDEDHKTLEFYGIKEGTMLIIDQSDE